MGGIIDSIFGGGDYEEPSTSREAAEIARQMFQQTTPVRSGVINELSRFMGMQPQQMQQPQTISIQVPQWQQGAGRDAGMELVMGTQEIEIPGAGMQQTGNAEPWSLSESPMWSPGKMAIEDQYNTARKNVMAGMPSGGLLQESLADVDMGRARSLTDLIGNIEQDMFDKSFTMATGIPQQSMAGLTQAANASTNAMMANANQQAGKNAMMGDLGMAAGMYFS